MHAELKGSVREDCIFYCGQVAEDCAINMNYVQNLSMDKIILSYLSYNFSSFTKCSELSFAAVTVAHCKMWAVVKWSG